MVRVREHASFAGRDFDIVEEVHAGHGRVQVYEFGVLDRLWNVGTQAEWDEAVATATKLERGRQAAEQAKADGEQWGLLVDYRQAFTGSACTTRIVRSTKTLLCDALGRRWSRRTGRRITGTAARLTDTSMEEIERFLAGRERVDIVAERKGGDQSVDLPLLDAMEQSS